MVHPPCCSDCSASKLDCRVEPLSGEGALAWVYTTRLEKIEKNAPAAAHRSTQNSTPQCRPTRRHACEYGLVPTHMHTLCIQCHMCAFLAQIPIDQSSSQRLALLLSIYESSAPYTRTRMQSNRCRASSQAAGAVFHLGRIDRLERD
jgi:hypothetical protein